MLNIKGYDFEKKYYYNGEITYSLKKKIKQEENIVLYTKPSDRVFKAIILSDIHIGNTLSRVELLDKVYDYCKKEGINIILNLGDLIDGMIGLKDLKQFNTYEEQIEYALKIHPLDPNILNFICLGNHDYDSLKNGGPNISNVFLSKRHDIIPLGYGEGILKVKNDEIVLCHGSRPENLPSLKSNAKHKLILHGHLHKSAYSNDRASQNSVLLIPTLSEMSLDNKYSVLPSFLCTTIEFNGGYFGNAVFEQFVFADKLCKVNGPITI